MKKALAIIVAASLFLVLTALPHSVSAFNRSRTPTPTSTPPTPTPTPTSTSSTPTSTPTGTVPTPTPTTPPLTFDRTGLTCSNGVRATFRQRGHELRSEHPHQRRLGGTEWRAPRIHDSRRQSSTWADDAEDLRVLRNGHRGHAQPERDLHLHDSGQGRRGRYSAADLQHHG